MPRLISMHKLGGDVITHSKDGYTYKQIAQIEELTGDVDRRLFDAENFHELPALFSAHPVIPRIFLKNKQGSFEKGSQSVALVTLNWGPKEEGEDEDEDNPTFATLAIINSTTTKKSNLDKNGNDITVSYNEERITSGGTVGTVVEQSGVYQRQVNQMTIRAKRRESVNAVAVALKYDEAINSTTFAGFPAGTFYATVSAEKVLSGAEYDITYEFRRNRDGWDPTVFASDPATNAPLPDLLKGQGIKTPEVYERLDFNQLGLGI